MIIDGHAYCFPPVDSPAGYDSVEDKLRVLQRELGGHHQSVWRIRDRAPADNGTLVDPDTQELRPITWRRRMQQFVWEYEGETFTKQYFPPMLRDFEATPEWLIAEMDYIGVEKAVLHHSPHLGLLNSFLRDAVDQFPERLTRLIAVRYATLPGDIDAAIQEFHEEVSHGGYCGVQFFTRHYYDGSVSEPWDDGAMQPFWQAVAELETPVYFTMQAPAGKRYSSDECEGYLDQQRILLRWMERYSNLAVVLTHGLPWRSFLEDNRIVFPEDIWDVFKAPQCHMQLLFPIQLGGLWEYPWKETEPTVKECVERLGADRLIWGTDMPMVARFCTYRQTMDQYRLHCDFLSEGERQAILGGTAARLLGLTG